MFADQELIELAARKVALQRDIALRRAQCAGAAVRVAQPLALLDRMLSLWRRLPPTARGAAIPLGWVVLCGIVRRRKALRSFVRWSSILVGAVRVIRAAVRMRHRSSPA